MKALVASTTLLLIVDVQERLAAAMPPATLDRLIHNVGVVLEAARILGVSVLATEQYPKGLGATMASVASRLLPLGVAPIEKMTFDACGEPSVASAIGSRAPSAIVMAGVEAHVCVFQTARTLVERGYAVHVLVDAVASRDEANRAAGIALCERAGAVSTVTEAVVFDWLERGGTDAFRAISKLVR